MAIKKHAVPFFKTAFPAALYNLSQPQDFDRWFVQTWSKRNAINVPPKGELKATAKRLARATVRQAWWSATIASKEYARGPIFSALKEARKRARKLSTQLDDFFEFLNEHGERPQGGQLRQAPSALNLIGWLEITVGKEDGRQELFDYRKFAEALLESRKFLDALEQNSTEQIERHRGLIKNVGKPDLVAFALPFVEATIFMTGEVPKQRFADWLTDGFCDLHSCL